MLSPDGTARTRFADPNDTGPAARAPELGTADLRAAVCECLYHSARYGSVPLRVAETPCIDTRSGACIGSIVNLEVVGPSALSAWRTGVDRRVSHEIMWEVYAASYDRILSELFFYQEVVERHCAALSGPAIGTVLDVGSGTGTVTSRLLGAGKRVTAVAINRAMLEQMWSKIDPGWGDRLTVIEDTAERLPHLRDGAFDGVNVLLAFFDMDDPIAALAEAQRVLKPGGTIIITEPRARFDVAALMAAAEESLRTRGILDRLSGDWRRIETVAPLVRDSIRDTEGLKAAPTARQDWHAEAIFDTLRRDGFTDPTFQESHLGNCATIRGLK
jgi:ubiquinone/menaquinone biosynthesis C-methylase UbiE